jgi:hypothetical protein
MADRAIAISSRKNYPSSMRILTPAELPDLPAEVCVLIADGVYALYELDESKHSTFSQARYILRTTHQTAYLLSTQGALIDKELLGAVETKLGALVTVNATSQGTVRING